MTSLRNDQSKQNDVKIKLKTIYSELLDLDADNALEYVKWKLEKIITNKKHNKEIALRLQLKSTTVSSDEYNNIKSEIRKILPKNYPNSLEQGDIINVNFGIGFAGELSDDHYAIILSNKGSMFLIAPLTKTPQPDRENIKYFENLNLPGENGKSYVNFGQIRYVHFRRIQNIIGIPEKKRHIDKIEVNDILEKFNKIIKGS